ncbi:MAG: hydroxyacid dehydrogenase [Planctomycetes bacterium]|nr:hydroxyacid dehydrogenase [Planctomycetota bacterium]
MAPPKVWYLPPRSHTEQVFRPETFQRLTEEFDVSVNPHPRNLTAEEVAEGIGPFDALVTGWGTPALPEAVFQKGPKLRLIAHSAGTVKSFFSEAVFRDYLVKRNVCVFSANEALALNVAEYTVGALIWTSRRFVDHVLAVRHRGAWRCPEIPPHGQFLRGATVGVVSASKVGREVIHLLGPFDVRLLCFDPYLSDADAAALDVERVGLDDLFRRSDLVTVHTPVTRETVGLIGARQLQLLRDGASLVNTSRGKILDADALLAEARTGRIFITLDVTDPEPLPPDHPLRALPNVYITPHHSGCGLYGYLRVGELTLMAIKDFFAGRPVRGRVRWDTYEHIG